MNVDASVITVNGIDYVPKGTESSNLKGPIKIVVLQRGWNMVGRFERNGSDCVLKDASVIRSWGTTKGLGEIAKDGPTSKTLLDKCHGEVSFDILTMVFSLDCEEAKWIKKL